MNLEYIEPVFRSVQGILLVVLNCSIIILPLLQVHTSSCTSARARQNLILAHTHACTHAALALLQFYMEYRAAKSIVNKEDLFHHKIRAKVKGSRLFHLTFFTCASFLKIKHSCLGLPFLAYMVMAYMLI